MVIQLLYQSQLCWMGQMDTVVYRVVKFVAAKNLRASGGLAAKDTLLRSCDWDSTAITGHYLHTENSNAGRGRSPALGLPAQQVRGRPNQNGPPLRPGARYSRRTPQSKVQTSPL